MLREASHAAAGAILTTTATTSMSSRLIRARIVVAAGHGVKNLYRTSIQRFLSLPICQLAQQLQFHRVVGPLFGKPTALFVGDDTVLIVGRWPSLLFGGSARRSFPGYRAMKIFNEDLN